MLGDGHTGVEVKRSGLVINPDYIFLGASPDGLVTNPISEDNNRLLEIKCPYAHKDITQLEAAQLKKFFCSLDDGKLSNKTTSLLLSDSRTDGNLFKKMVQLCNMY